MPRRYISVGPTVSFTNRSDLSFLKKFVAKSPARKIYRIRCIVPFFSLEKETEVDDIFRQTRAREQNAQFLLLSFQKAMFRI